MLSITHSIVLTGLQGIPICVEIDMVRGLPAFSIVGLPDIAVKESKERIRAAIGNAGFEFPVKRLTINLSPANERKEGSHLDLPMAMGVLYASKVIKTEIAKMAFLGELSLSGEIKPVEGVLPMLIGLKEHGFTQVFIPEGNRQEAALVQDMAIYPFKTLTHLVKALNAQDLDPLSVEDISEIFSPGESDLCFSDVRGQHKAKFALEVAAAGGHNVLMVGPPGAGKTMLAKRFGTILPPMAYDEILESTKIYSISGLLKGRLHMSRPFRAPHHTISNASMAGGGKFPKPGEVTLAHLGVLFLDELPEFQRQVLETLRQPLENGEVRISRVNGNMNYPSRFTLLAAMNPCPCGYHLDEEKECQCSQQMIQKYQSKISGPLLDRIDIHLTLKRAKYAELSTKKEGETSEQIRERVINARQIQEKRFLGGRTRLNADMNTNEIEKYCTLGTDEATFMESAFKLYKMSGRVYHKVLKLARTLADMEASEPITTRHLSQALSMRMPEVGTSGEGRS